MVRDVAERFLEKVRRHPTECWEWTGYVAPHGYGQFWHLGGPKWAHRVAFELFVRPLRAGFTVDHECQNTRCMRPSHLRERKNSTNAALRWVRRRISLALAARKARARASDTSRDPSAPRAA